MAVNKNFVVKNGIEVATDLIYATSDLDKVGIGSTIPTSTLEVGGDSKVTGNSTVVGIATIQDNLEIGVGGTVITADVQAGRIGLHTSPQHNVHISNRNPGTSSTSLYVDGGNVKIDGGLDATNLYVTGITTLGDGLVPNLVDINADVDMDANLHLTGVSTFSGLVSFGGTANARVEPNGRFYYGLVGSGLTNAGVSIGGTGDYTAGRLSLHRVNTTPGTNSGLGEITFTDAGSVEAASIKGKSDGAWTSGVSQPSRLQFFTTGAGTSTLGAPQLEIGESGQIDISHDLEVVGVVTASSFYGDGSNLTGIATSLTATIGIKSEGSVIGSGITQIDFASTNGTAIAVDVPPATAAGVATVTITPGVSIGLVIALGS